MLSADRNLKEFHSPTLKSISINPFSSERVELFYLKFQHGRGQKGKRGTKQGQLQPKQAICKVITY